MAPIDEVTAAINWIFQKPQAAHKDFNKAGQATENTNRNRPRRPRRRRPAAKARRKPGSHGQGGGPAKAKASQADQEPAAGQEAGRKAAKKAASKGASRRAQNAVNSCHRKRLTDDLESFNTRHPFCISTTPMPARAEGRVSSRHFAFSPQDRERRNGRQRPATGASRRGSYRGCQPSDQQARRYRAAIHPRHRPEEGQRDHGKARTFRRSGACRSSPTRKCCTSAR